MNEQTVIDILTRALASLGIPAYEIVVTHYQPRRAGWMNHSRWFASIPDWKPDPRWNDLSTVAECNGFSLRP